MTREYFCLPSKNRKEKVRIKLKKDELPLKKRLKSQIAKVKHVLWVKESQRNCQIVVEEAFERKESRFMMQGRIAKVKTESECQG